MSHFVKTTFSLACWALLVAGTAHAEVKQIKGQGVQFVPLVVFAKPGDTISFRNMSTHYVESLPNMIPAGAQLMKSEMGADYDYVAEREGVYVYKCPPHWGARMGGVLVVGDPGQLEPKLGEYLEAAEGDRTTTSFLSKVRSGVSDGIIKP